MADTGRPAFCCGRAHVAPAWLPDTGSARLNVSMSSTTLAALRRTARLMRERAAAARRDERGVGESLALLVLWPMLVVAVLVLLVHAFIVTNAQAEAEVAASAGLRAAWRSAANEDFLSQRESDGKYTGAAYTGAAFHPAVLEMGWAAEDAAARAAATKTGWRWWTPGATAVHSDWCNPAADRPGPGQSGWVRVVVSGEVFGPLAALWPNRLDRVHAAATGPAVLLSPLQGQQDLEVPADLPPC